MPDSKNQKAINPFSKADSKMVYLYISQPHPILIYQNEQKINKIIIFCFQKKMRRCGKQLREYRRICYEMNDDDSRSFLEKHAKMNKSSFLYRQN